MNLTDHDNVAIGAMLEPTRAQQAEYYRLYAEIEASFEKISASFFSPASRLIHAEVAQRMNIKEEL